MNLKETHEDVLEQLDALLNKMKTVEITLDHGIDYESFQELSMRWRMLMDKIVVIVSSLALIAGSEAGYMGGYQVGLRETMKEKTESELKDTQDAVDKVLRDFFKPTAPAVDEANTTEQENS